MMHLVHKHKVCKFVEPRNYPPQHAMCPLQFARYGYVLISAVGTSGNRTLALLYARDTQGDG